jgi:arabinofuranan 3-O-arabinosyltransferase
VVRAAAESVTWVGRRLLVPAFLLGASLYVMAIDLIHMPNGRHRGQIWLGVDFHTYLAAALVGLQHGWFEIYDQGLVRAAQGRLVPNQFTQPFLSPPVDSWLAVPLTALPYSLALGVWASVLLIALVFALGWSSSYQGPARIAAVAVALTPWWVLLAIYVGQIVPLVAAALLVAWRLVKEDREIAAGLVLSVLALKPNTAVLVPFALLAAGRWRTFLACAAASAVLAGLSLLAVGMDGVNDYLGSLDRLPGGATALTLGGAFGLSGPAAMAVRAAIVLAALVAAFAQRGRPGMAMAIGAIASLLTAPYLHNSDLCVLVAAGWIVWHEAPVWRAALVAMLLAASPYLLERNLGTPLEGWVRIEAAFLAGLVITALLTRQIDGSSIDAAALTGRAELGRRVTA